MLVSWTLNDDDDDDDVLNLKFFPEITCERHKEKDLCSQILDQMASR